MGRKLIKSKSDKVRHDHIYNLVEGDVENFIKDCLSLPHTVSVESLKPDHSFFRIKRDDISIEEAMEFIFASKVKFFSFILRSGFGSELNLNKKYWEFGASGLIGGGVNILFGLRLTKKVVLNWLRNIILLKIQNYKLTSKERGRWFKKRVILGFKYFGPQKKFTPAFNY